MAADDDKYRLKNIKNPLTERDESEDEGGESGGQGGKIDFVDFLDSGAEKRDDLLTGDEKRHLLITHKEVHETKVKHQKEKIELNKQLKDGKISRVQQSHGMGAPAAPGGDWKFKSNPALANFGKGVDIKVTALPNEVVADTNQEQKNELQNQLRYANQPKFNPKPHGPGSY